MTARDHLEPSDLRRIAGLSLVTEHTIRRVLDGERVRDNSRDRVRAALHALSKGDDTRAAARAELALDALAAAAAATTGLP